MSRIVFGTWMIRYPLGGNLSWAVQYLLGLKNNGHEVYLVEKAHYPNACYNPVTRETNDDGTHGMNVVHELLSRFGLGNNWCFVDYTGNYWGLPKNEIEEVFRTADVFIDSGAHDSWCEESQKCQLRALIEGEPAFTQFKWANNLAKGIPIPKYDYYFSNGRNIGMPGNSVPTFGVEWRHVFNPVDTSLLQPALTHHNPAYSTVMNWQSHAPIQFNGISYGQKDVEFARFETLPQLVHAPMSVAVSGKNVPEAHLRGNGWSILDAQAVTESFDSYRSFIHSSRGEFSVCKNIFIANNTGWFSDRSAAYLASGRPVVLQDTGFSQHLPVGEGLFAVGTVEEAKEAIQKIEADYGKHARRAREIACEFLDATIVMGKFLEELGIPKTHHRKERQHQLRHSTS
jgi:hypothetical protein